MNFIFSTGLDLKETLIDPEKADLVLNGKDKQKSRFIYCLGRPELIADFIPTPRNKRSLDQYMLNDEKDRLYQIKNLEKIRNTIFNDYKSNHDFHNVIRENIRCRKGLFKGSKNKFKIPSKINNSYCPRFTNYEKQKY